MLGLDSLSSKPDGDAADFLDGQPISGGVGVLWLLPGAAFDFFGRWRNWPDGGSPPSGEGEDNGARGEASHARTCSRCDRARIRF